MQIFVSKIYPNDEASVDELKIIEYIKNSTKWCAWITNRGDNYRRVLNLVFTNIKTLRKWGGVPCNDVDWDYIAQHIMYMCYKGTIDSLHKASKDFPRRAPTTTVNNIGDFIQGTLITTGPTPTNASAVGTTSAAIKEINNEMNRLPVFETKTFLNGVEVTSYTDDQLIAMIADLEDQVRALDRIDVSSSTIRSRIKGLRVGIKELAAELDGRHPKPARKKREDKATSAE